MTVDLRKAMSEQQLHELQLMRMDDDGFQHHTYTDSRTPYRRPETSPKTEPKYKA